MEGSQLTALLPDPRTEPFARLDLYQRVVGVSRSTVYELARRNELGIPCHRFGNSYRVRTIDLYRMTGLPVPGEDDLLSTVGA